MKQIRFTKEGYEKLKQDYEALKASRPPAVQDLKKARDLGDLSENGYYKAARAKLSSIDYRLFRIKVELKQAVIIDQPQGNRVVIGKQVTLKSGNKKITYQIVGDLEANPTEGKISLLSPIGRALEGKHVGDSVEFNSPSGKIHYVIEDLK